MPALSLWLLALWPLCPCQGLVTTAGSGERRAAEAERTAEAERKARQNALMKGIAADVNAAKGSKPSRQVGSAPRTPEEAAADHGGVQGLCDYWGWQPLQPGARRPRIHYGTVTGNENQEDTYELAFEEVSPFVSSIVAVDPKMTHMGHPRNLSFDMSLPNFRRFRHQLRHVELENPANGKMLRAMSNEEKDLFFKRPGKNNAPGFAIEQWSRAQIERGLKDSKGNWEIDENDIVIVADSDEIPLRPFLAALQLCEVPSFQRVNQDLDNGENKSVACRHGSVLSMLTQVYEYFMDCPTTVPLWWHPNVALARCIMNGEVDLEDVRTSAEYVTDARTRVGARHLHNVGMSLEDIIFKYGHYVEPRAPGMDSGLDTRTNEEMMWRACDPTAPEISAGSWHMRVRPSGDFLQPDNRRGYNVQAESRQGVDAPFALLESRPELIDRFYWKGHAERKNPFVGGPGGTYHWNGTQMVNDEPPAAEAESRE